MPRTPLRSTSSNRTSRKELEPFQRGIIVGRFLAGQKKADIEREMNLPYTTIQTTIQPISPPPLALVLLALDGQRSFLMLISDIFFHKSSGIPLLKLKISANYLGCPFLHALLHACYKNLGMATGEHKKDLN